MGDGNGRGCFGLAAIFGVSTHSPLSRYPKMGQLLSLADLASRLGVALATIHRLRARKELPREIKITARSIRFDLADVLAWEAERSGRCDPAEQPALLRRPAAVV
jgi:predicted DNA-binding transcriptional regulator AlpA